LCQERLDLLAEVTVVHFIDDSYEERRYSIDLVKLLVPKVATGVVLDGDVELPEGLHPHQGGNFPSENDRVRRRFLSRFESRFYVIPSHLGATVRWDSCSAVPVS
jgi:hypothetical protein